jgi:hypothetical protein
MKPKSNFLFLPATALILFSGLQSCRKSNPVLPGNILNVDTVISDSTNFIDVTLDGKRTLGINDPALSPPAWGNIWSPNDPDTSIFMYNRVGTSFAKNTPNSLPQFSFSLGTVYPFSKPPGQPPANIIEVSVADSFFSPRNVNYSQYAGDTSFSEVGDSTIVFWRTLTRTLLSPGVTISWVDSTGTVWETLYGAADQTGSYFTITAFQLRNAALPGYANIVTLTAGFACTLYDGKGHFMRLTQGRLRQTMWL